MKVSPVLACACALVLAACGSRPLVDPEPLPPPLWIPSAQAGGVVVIVNDAMRRDRSSVYGGPVSTPALDALAGSGVVFANAFSPAPWTKPSIASLFTSLYPSQHRVATHPDGQVRAGASLHRAISETDVMSSELTTLAEILLARDYRTAAIVSNPWMDRRFGFDQGFETYDDSFAGWGAPGKAVSAAGLAWLRGVAPGRKFFLYLHYLDTHRPHGRLRPEEVQDRALELAADPRPLSAEASAEIAELARLENGERVVDLGVRPSLRLLELIYDRGVERFDEALGELLQGLAARPDHDRIAVFVTSDHGEAMYARGWGNHGVGLYDDEVAIPLIARVPGASPSRGWFKDPVSLVDLMPTICAYTGANCGPNLAGRSLIRRNGADPDPAPRYVVSEGVSGRPSNRSIRNRRFKLIFEPMLRDGNTNRDPYALFDVSRDPQEIRNLLAPPPAPEHARLALRVMMPGLETAVPSFKGPAPQRAPVDAEMSERLRALGYVN